MKFQVNKHGKRSHRSFARVAAKHRLGQARRPRLTETQFRKRRAGHLGPIVVRQGGQTESVSETDHQELGGHRKYDLRVSISIFVL